VLLVAGKIDVNKTLALVVKYFGSIPKPSRVIQPCYTVEPPQDGERSVTLSRVGDVQSVSVGYHVVSGADPDYAAFDVLNEVLVNQPNGRLYQSMVKSDLASNVMADNPALKDPGYFYITADVLKEKSVKAAKTALFNTIDDFSTNPVTPAEVEKAIAKLTKNFEETYRNTTYTGLTLSEYMAQGDWRLAFLYRDRLKKVTADDVNRIIKTYFINSNRTVGMFLPTAAPVRATPPNQPDVAALVKDYKGQQALAQAEAFDPSPTNIEKRTKRGTIAGGAKYALLSKTTRGNTVEARITLRIGDETSLQNKASIASLTAAMLKRGTTAHTMAQINETLDKLSSTVNFFGGGQQVFISIKSTKPNLAKTLDLVNEMLHDATFPEEEFKTLKTENVSGLQQERSEPQSIAFREFSTITSLWPKGHINYSMSADEETEAINAATLKDVKSFYKSFYNGANATAAFVGEFDEATVTDKLNKMLGNWTSSKSYTRIADKFDDVPAKNKEIKTPDKKNAMMVCGMNLRLRDDNPDYPALSMGDFIFGGGFLNSRLATRIRQKEGISYGVGSWLQAGSRDEAGAFGSYAIYNPENKEKLEKAWMEELNKMLNEGFTEKELKEAKSGYLQYRETGRAEDAQLASTLNSRLELGRTMDWDKAMDDKLKNLSLADLNKTMKKYLIPGKITFVKAGDFK
jgi:zinc protease